MIDSLLKRFKEKYSEYGCFVCGEKMKNCDCMSTFMDDIEDFFRSALQKEHQMFCLTDYKNKHYVICDRDRVHEDDFVVREMTRKEVIDEDFVKRHKELCKYYGIPPYIGNDENLLKVYN